MKKLLPHVLLLLAALATGCVGGKKDNVVPAPDGTYSGQYRLLHIHTNHTIDTVKANISLYMSPTSTFKLTGDTSTVHAGSFGSFAANTDYSTITFTDKTYSQTTGNTVKMHLNGVYQYEITGNKFAIEGFASDTLIAQYDLQRIN